MMSDIVIDFDNHLKNGRVYLVEIETEYQDAPDDQLCTILIDMYVIANSYYMAQFIANSIYPDVAGIHVHEYPIDEYAYAARRNRSIL